MSLGRHRAPRLVVVGQAVRPTGFARVIEELLRRLAPRYDCHLFGINYRGSRLERGGWQLHPNAVLGDPLGTAELPKLLAKLRPDVLLFVHDQYLYAAHREALAGIAIRPKTIAYFPVEGVGLEPSIVEGLAGLDRLVVYNPAARAEVELAANRLGASALPRRGVDVIPHGIDLSQFGPCVSQNEGGPDSVSRAAARRQLLPERPELRDAFLVLNANRNVPRKRIDLTIQAFAQFCSDKPPSVMLYLHTGMRDCGWDIPDLLRRYRIDNRTLLTTHGAAHPDVSDERLNLIYNACDVGLNTATGEGWGLVAFEHAASGGVPVLPRYGACESLWHGDGAILVEPVARFRDPHDCVEQAVVGVAEVASALEHLYTNRDELRRRSTAARRWVARSEWRWSSIADQWDALLRETLPEPTCPVT